MVCSWNSLNALAQSPLRLVRGFLLAAWVIEFGAPSPCTRWAFYRRAVASAPIKKGHVAIVLALLVLTVGLTVPPVGAAPGPTIQGDARSVAELTEIYKKFGDARSWRA